MKNLKPVPREINTNPELDKIIQEEYRSIIRIAERIYSTSEKRITIDTPMGEFVFIPTGIESKE